MRMIKMLTGFHMNKVCIRKIYEEYLADGKNNYELFVSAQSEAHSCDPNDIENLVHIYGSYLTRQDLLKFGATVNYDKYSMLCFKILDEINGIISPKEKPWWKFWV